MGGALANVATAGHERGQAEHTGHWSQPRALQRLLYAEGRCLGSSDSTGTGACVVLAVGAWVQDLGLELHGASGPQRMV